MGYCINMEVKHLTLAAENVSKALKAINDLHDVDQMKKQAGGGSFGPDGRTYHYSWVSNPPEGGFTDIVKALHAWRYEARILADGSVEVLHFNGEKLGDCQYLWTALQKLVDPNSEIQCRGEDGCQWRWVFKGGKFKEQTSKLIWED
jgi:hypothetical protein